MKSRRRSVAVLPPAAAEDGGAEEGTVADAFASGGVVRECNGTGFDFAGVTSSVSSEKERGGLPVPVGPPLKGVFRVYPGGLPMGRFRRASTAPLVLTGNPVSSVPQPSPRSNPTQALLAAHGA